jgi:hypothetical protein
MFTVFHTLEEDKPQNEASHTALSPGTAEEGPATQLNRQHLLRCAAQTRKCDIIKWYEVYFKNNQGP